MGAIYSGLWAAGAILLAYVVATTPLLRIADAPPQPGRVANSIDGLRGFLALSVVLHHAAIYRDYVIEGVWRLPPSKLYSTLGYFGVAFFFMITAYLFWGQVLTRRLTWWKFYVGRVFRIGPLYFFAFAIVFGITVIASGGIVTPWFLLAKRIIQWSTMGLWGAPELNGFPNTGNLLAGVTWSLRYEWGFYLALPALALLRRSPLALGLCGSAVTLIALSLTRAPWPSLEACTALFFLGITCASAPKLKVGAIAGSAAAICLVLLAYFASHPQGPGALSLILLGGAFYLFTQGANLFGVLTSKGALRLGNISYGIYLLQGLALAAVAPLLRGDSPGVYWASIMLAVLGLIGVSCLTHVLIERPGIEAGRAFTDLLANGRLRRLIPIRTPKS